MWGDLKPNWGKTKELINVEKDTDNSGLEDLKDKSYQKFIEKTYQIIKKVDEIGLPKPNEQIRLVTFRPFNAIHFLNYIAKKQTINHVIIAVYSINAEAARFLNEMIESGLIKKATILMSNLRNKAHREKEQITRDLFVNNQNVELFFCSSHAKIMAMETYEGDYYVLEGSGNLSYNSRVEQYVLDNDKKLFNFTLNWMMEIRQYLAGQKELIIT